MKIKIKRIYEPRSPEDGVRILVDRLWPRGVKKEDAGIDFWLKDIAPSNELRRSFGHDPKNFEAFRESYTKELIENDSLPELMGILARYEVATLLFAAKDEYLNNANVLLEVVENSSLKSGPADL